jgi:hypothetical protein
MIPYVIELVPGRGGARKPSPPESGRVRELPPWAAALPLWAGTRWLWLRLSPEGLVAVSSDSTGGNGSNGSGGRDGEATGSEDLFGSASYDLVVVDSRVAGAIAPAFWNRLAASLEPGTLLIVCAKRRGRLREQIGAATPLLRASAWHAIEPDHEGSWRLRPATRAMHTWCDHHLSPPYSLRPWLWQSLRRWLPPAQRLVCLPVWREDTR